MAPLTQVETAVLITIATLLSVGHMMTGTSQHKRCAVAVSSLNASTDRTRPLIVVAKGVVTMR